ncbi:hypothetical protein T484DRAFT_1794162 [Baffinella frigidus]|nr:hypothetical protein T484DRAFT_1794162 [Cryptophyta sp. CCMP2293]
MAAALLLAACARPSAALEERGRWKRGCRGGAGGGGGGAAFVGGGVALGEMSELAQNGAGQDTNVNLIIVCQSG